MPGRVPAISAVIAEAGEDAAGEDRDLKVDRADKETVEADLRGGQHRHLTCPSSAIC